MNIDQLGEFFIEAFPVMDESEQYLALTLYRLLASGNPVAVDQLQENLELSASEIHKILHDWPGVFFDDEERVIGFWGITLEDMPHRMLINGHTRYAWCAWDTLFIPALLGQNIEVESNCPLSGCSIKLSVTPTSVELLDSSREILVSFLTPDPVKLRQDVTTNFCHFVFFFDSRVVANAWIAEHPGTFLLTLNEAFQVGQAVNTARYQQSLVEPSLRATGI